VEVAVIHLIQLLHWLNKRSAMLHNAGLVHKVRSDGDRVQP
jgi:hypothetical protein